MTVEDFIKQLQALDPNALIFSQSGWENVQCYGEPRLDEYTMDQLRNIEGYKNPPREDGDRVVYVVECL